MDIFWVEKRPANPNYSPGRLIWQWLLTRMRVFPSIRFCWNELIKMLPQKIQVSIIVLGIRRERTGAGALLRDFCRMVDIPIGTRLQSAWGGHKVNSGNHRGRKLWRKQRSHARGAWVYHGQKEGSRGWKWSAEPEAEERTSCKLLTSDTHRSPCPWRPHFSPKDCRGQKVQVGLWSSQPQESPVNRTISERPEFQPQLCLWPLSPGDSSAGMIIITVTRNDRDIKVLRTEKMCTEKTTHL